MRSFRYILSITVLAFSTWSCAEPVSLEKAVELLEEGNYAQAYCHLEPLATKGNKEAQYRLGWMYANGEGMLVDTSQAVAWWKKAGEQGNVDAQMKVASAYILAEGVDEDEYEAARWFAKAANEGEAQAASILATMSSKGNPDAINAVENLIKKESPVYSQMVVLKANKGNLRSEPNTTSDVLIQMNKGEKAHLLTRKGDWYMVGLHYKEDKIVVLGWLFSSLIKKLDKPQTAKVEEAK